MVLTPTYVFNEEDLGDATVSEVWTFAEADSLCPLFRDFGGSGAVCNYVKPTLFNSYYIDVNMKCDATQGGIDNDVPHGTSAAVKGGTRFTVPSRYGAYYKLVAEEEITDVTIAGKNDFESGMEGTNHTVGMAYYNSTTDSIEIEIGQDMHLVSITASYPGGDNTLSWTPNLNVAESSLGTREKAGLPGALLYNMSDLTNNGSLEITPSAAANLSTLIEMPAAKDEAKCISVTFDIKNGFSFKPKIVSVPIMPVGAGTSTNVELVLSDAKGSRVDTLYTAQKTDSLKCDTLLVSATSKQTELYMYGSVTLKIYVYGAAANYRLGFPITIMGEMCETVAFPEGEYYIPYLTKSAIDFDGLGLINVKAYEVVGVRGREGHRFEESLVTLVPIEEIPMGDPIIAHTQEPGAVYNIPLTRNDDPHIGTNNLLRVSDGFVVTAEDAQTMFRFENWNGVYCFRRAVQGETIPEEEIYLRWWNAYPDVDAYYFSESDVPDSPDVPTLIPVVLSENNATKPKKIWLNGRILIVMPDGSVYTLDGIKLK